MGGEDFSDEKELIIDYSVINIFCIIGDFYNNICLKNILDLIIADNEFLFKSELSELKYNYISNYNLNNNYIKYDENKYKKYNCLDIVQSRIEFIDKEKIIFFTLKEDIEKNKNIICITSPYQYDDFNSWFSVMNEKNKFNHYRLYSIIIPFSLANMIKYNYSDLITYSNKDIDNLINMYIKYRSEYRDMIKKYPEFENNLNINNSLYINENTDILDKINKIKQFILKTVCNEQN